MYIALILLLIVIAAVAVTGVFISIVFGLDQNEIMLATIGTLVSFIVLAACVLLIPALGAARASDKCVVEGENYERETRFVRYDHWGYDCLMETDRGWFPINDVIRLEGVTIETNS